MSVHVMNVRVEGKVRIEGSKLSHDFACGSGNVVALSLKPNI